MQQFTVPQFIDVEDKIIGPITTRQFIIMLAGFAFIGISYKVFDFSLFITFGIITFGVSGIFAFLKINGMPFHFFVLNFIQTLKRPGIRVWNNYIYQKDTDWKEEKLKVTEKLPQIPAKIYAASRLAELSLVVDTGGAYKGNESGSGDEIKTKSESLDIKGRY